MRTIYVPVTHPDDLEDCLDQAIPLVQAFCGHLAVEFLRPDPRASIPFVGEGLTADVIQDLVEAAEREGRARADQALAVFRARMEEAEIAVVGDEVIHDLPTAAFSQAVGLIAERVGRLARVHDLSVVPRPAGDHRPEAGELFNETLFRSGRPVLLAPPDGGKRAHVGAEGVPWAHVVIGWNGRAEAARAVADALPILARAAAVEIVTVGDEHPERPGAALLARHLAHHGIRAEVVRIDGPGGVGEALLRHAGEAGADLIVLGAYSHSRWREMIVGGVTRHVIHHSPVALFMSH
ncbi:MAG: universal stress protein UspA [Rhodothalassiaceae bacterium]|nr:MAG: universal stress protein UspA [Rhodothalassiaceae bacterium]